MNNLFTAPTFWAEVSCSTFIAQPDPSLRPKVIAAIRKAGLRRIGTSLYHGILSLQSYEMLVSRMNELATSHVAERFIFKVRDQEATHWTTLIGIGVEHQ
jgi:CRISPR/Cas system-associated endoribonuclease Cas2